ncbi:MULTISPECIES: ATP-binding protein [Mesorhizobium]|uniref:histidine kinase n=1 Tax=Mesorhizobium shonense TaxID=1209948 RepID=A0ABV2HX72_9HYPH|nr:MULTISPECIES: ATP-binding protein [unclassified Mesorhizobium]AZO28411.1 two-component sensor histidine kinase [Mesorhizobium sp. M1B.F.Ca.ET.045.04.1.1]RWE03123.1 MAG: two-component sensor histidine kinase [Mesorhizobium sp.]TIS45560.1 MAG: two-component sensor histidine kinase [Mesorhizobium sp.]
MTDKVYPCENKSQSQLERDGRSQLPAASLDALTAIERREHTAYRLAALGEMTSGIAHDFRNLLAVIESGLRLAEKRADEPERVRAFIAMAREGIDRGIDLTSQLLAFAKHRELEAHAGDLNEFLRSFEPLLRYGAGPDIRVRLELSSDIPDCLIDPALFDTAVLNLIVNARDAMPDGGEIGIVTEPLVQETATPDPPGPGTFVCVRVKDQGCGMTAEVLRKAFDPFFTTKGEKGTGIGLSQVQALIRMVGGHVRIASEPGLGTTVDLLFPSIQPEAEVSSKVPMA